jgi:hypothetical protein
MPQQVINIGLAANDNTGDPIRTAFDKSNDNFTELYADVATLQGSQVVATDLIRAQHNIACTGSVGQVIAFSTQFVTDYAITIIDFSGIGIQVTAQDEDGFTITSLSAGNFSYIASIEI